MGDAGRLQQVVWNLLSNAVKFTPAGGQIEVQLEEVENAPVDPNLSHHSSSSLHPSIVRLSAQMEAHRSIHPYAQITVTDTGKGINPDFLPYVFDHFRQEDGATTRQFGGLGLGLAIARQIVEMHGGTVAVDSPGEGYGTTFTVRIPLASQSIDLLPLESPPDLTEDLSGIQILVVDDETDSREFIAFLLEQAHAIVTAVASGNEALQALERSTPDVIISDIGMPEMDGYMLMRHIRSLPSDRGGQTPAIALTAYAGEVNQQQAIAAGFQRHLVKPVDLNAVIMTVVQCLRSEHHKSAEETTL